MLGPGLAIQGHFSFRCRALSQVRPGWGVGIAHGGPHQKGGSGGGGLRRGWRLPSYLVAIKQGWRQLKVPPSASAEEVSFLIGAADALGEALRG